MKEQESSLKYDSRIFTCKRCGKEVITIQGVLDRRSVFCSAICRRRYWRHSDRRHQESK
ncbi:hypothetical protein GMA11_08690 [Granulicatella sp. zg-ZJ]|nr:hypothetical protein [Granulicatella sp. zg-ZJ]